MIIIAVHAGFGSTSVKLELVSLGQVQLPISMVPVSSYEIVVTPMCVKIAWSSAGHIMTSQLFDTYPLRDLLRIYSLYDQ